MGGVQIDMDTNLYEHKRSIYNMLDLLGDVGGLREALITIGQIFLAIFGPRGLNGFLASKLFWTEGPCEANANAERIVAARKKFKLQDGHPCMRILGLCS